MSVCSIRDKIDQLYGQYKDRTYGDEGCSIECECPFSSSGFIGSQEMVYISSDSIKLSSGACVAAKLVSLVAADRIELGVNQIENAPVRIYAPVSLNINTPHLSIGNLNFIELPKKTSLFCRTLTLKKPIADDDEFCELFESWITNDNAQIERVFYESSSPAISPAPSELFQNGSFREERVQPGSWPTYHSSLLPKQDKSRSFSKKVFENMA